MGERSVRHAAAVAGQIADCSDVVIAPTYARIGPIGKGIQREKVGTIRGPQCDTRSHAASGFTEGGRPVSTV